MSGNNITGSGGNTNGAGRHSALAGGNGIDVAK